ncbi:MAG: outer membrane lipoprotein-sorting protein [bacterium]|nr:outer membrane lipoprotein-sorting protein [bacterium]MCP5068234.1 outer membrane lipoprotein-sorting protein [bacterium]
MRATLYRLALAASLTASFALILAGPVAWAAEPPVETPVETPVEMPAEDAVTPQSELTGREIYQCVLDNRFESYIQHSSLLSGDRGGATQISKLRMTWKNFRELERRVLSRSLVKYVDPFDLRFSGYLIQNNTARANDQFVYLASSRRVRRVNLRREAVFGTDFTFEDVVPREIEDGDYARLPDKMIDGVPTYVVEVIPKDHTNSDYSKFVAHVEKEHCVPLLTIYWDEKDIEVKNLSVPAAKIQELEGIWIPMELTMRNLQLDTFTTLTIDDMEPNPELHRKTFDLSRLESH